MSKPSTSRGRWRRYTDEEEKYIVNYIIENNRYEEVRGRKLWIDMETEKICDRTWQSMKEHFRKKIIHIIPKFKLTENEETLLTNCYAARSTEDDRVETNCPNCVNCVNASERLSLDFLSLDSEETIFEIDGDVALTKTTNEPIFDIYTDADDRNVIQVKRNDIHVSFAMKELLISSPAEGVRYINLHEYGRLYLLKEVLGKVKKEMNTFASDISEKKYDQISSSDCDEIQIFDLILSNCTEYMCEFSTDVMKNFRAEIKRKICEIMNAEQTADKNENQTNRSEERSIIIPDDEISSTSTALNGYSPTPVISAEPESTPSLTNYEFYMELLQEK